MKSISSLFKGKRKLGRYKLEIDPCIGVVNPFIKGDGLYRVVNPDGRVVNKLKEPIKVELMGREELATDTFVYRFALPDRNRCLGHDTCQYLEFEAEIENKESGNVEKH